MFSNWIVFIIRLTIQKALPGSILCGMLCTHLLIVGGVHGWVGVGLLGLLLLVPHDHLHRLGPADLCLLLLLSLVILHSGGSLSLDVGQVLERRHLDSNWRAGWRVRSIKGQTKREVKRYLARMTSFNPPTADIPTLLNAFINSLLAGECSRVNSTKLIEYAIPAPLLHSTT